MENSIECTYCEDRQCAYNIGPGAFYYKWIEGSTHQFPHDAFGICLSIPIVLNLVGDADQFSPSLVDEYKKHGIIIFWPLKAHSNKLSIKRWELGGELYRPTLTPSLEIPGKFYGELVNGTLRYEIIE